MPRAIQVVRRGQPNLEQNRARGPRAWARRVPCPSAFLAFAVMSTLDFAFVACRSGGARRENEVVPPAPDVTLHGIPDRKNVRVLLETDRGSIHCTIDAARTPMAAALFVGFSAGRAAYRDPRSGAIVRSPLY